MPSSTHTRISQGRHQPARVGPGHVRPAPRAQRPLPPGVRCPGYVRPYSFEAFAPEHGACASGGSSVCPPCPGVRFGAGAIACARLCIIMLFYYAIVANFDLNCIFNYPSPHCVHRPERLRARGGEQERVLPHHAQRGRCHVRGRQHHWEFRHGVRELVR